MKNRAMSGSCILVVKMSETIIHDDNNAECLLLWQKNNFQVPTICFDKVNSICRDVWWRIIITTDHSLQYLKYESVYFMKISFKMWSLSRMWSLSQLWSLAQMWYRCYRYSGKTSFNKKWRLLCQFQRDSSKHRLFLENTGFWKSLSIKNAFFRSQVFIVLT